MAFMRPSPLLAQYATPVHGLYLCSAGTHPGGGVMGACGHSAAQRVHEGPHAPLAARRPAYRLSMMRKTTFRDPACNAWPRVRNCAAARTAPPPRPRAPTRGAALAEPVSRRMSMSLIRSAVDLQGQRKTSACSGPTRAARARQSPSSRPTAPERCSAPAPRGARPNPAPRSPGSWCRRTRAPQPFPRGRSCRPGTLPARSSPAAPRCRSRPGPAGGSRSQ